MFIILIGSMNEIVIIIKEYSMQGLTTKYEIEIQLILNYNKIKIVNN